MHTGSIVNAGNGQGAAGSARRARRRCPRRPGLLRRARGLPERSRRCQLTGSPRPSDAADQILFADERLTMSANMAAATGEERWIDRYEQALPLIDSAIADAMALAPPEVARRFDAETRSPTTRLVRSSKTPSMLCGGATSRWRVASSTASPIAPTRRCSARARRGSSIGVVGWVAERSRRGAGQGALALRRSSLPLTGACSAAPLAHRQREPCSIGGGVPRYRAEDPDARDERHAHRPRQPRRRCAMPSRSRSNGPSAIGSKLALLMIDLDRFKPINDRHGHMIGDLVLKEVARADVGPHRQRPISAPATAATSSSR